MVSGWIDSGLLKGWRLPDSKDRRVDIDHLRAFCAENGLPQEYVTGGNRPLLVWVMDEENLIYVKIVKAVLGAVRDVKVEIVHGSKLGFRVGLEKPDVVVMNYDLEGRDAVMSMNRILPKEATLVVLVSGDMSQTCESVLNNNNSVIVRY